MVNFLVKAVAQVPDFVGRQIYYSPTQKSNIECVINPNGSISVVSYPDKTFMTATALLNAMFRGELGENTTFVKSRRPARSVFSKDLFLKTGRHGSLYKFFQQRMNGKNDPTVLEQSSEPLSNAEANNDTECGQGNAKDPKETVTDAQSESDTVVYGVTWNTRIQRRICTGFDRAPFNDLITKMQWDTGRAYCTTLQIDATSIRSGSCSGEVESRMAKKTMCDHCYTSWRQLRRKKPKDETKRLLFSKESNLSPDDMRMKMKMFQKMLNEEKLKCGKLQKRLRNTTEELAQYKPTDSSCQSAVRVAVVYFNASSEKYNNSVCKWREDDCVCGRIFDSYSTLSSHVHSSHLSVTNEAPTAESSSDLTDTYNCRWDGCVRKTSFQNRRLLHKHVENHTGTRQSYDDFIFRKDLLSTFDKRHSGHRFSEQVFRPMQPGLAEGDRNRKRKRASACIVQPSLHVSPLTIEQHDTAANSDLSAA